MKAKLIMVNVLLAALTIASPAIAEVKARLGHVNAVGGQLDKSADEFARLVKERTNGEINIRVFPAGQIGSDEALGRDLARGAVEFSFLNPVALSGMDRLLDFGHLPYIVTNFEDADKFILNPNGIVQKTVTDTLAAHGIRQLSAFELEFRALTNSKQPVENVEDLQGLRLRIPGSAMMKVFFEKANVQAVTMPIPELFVALQQGTVDGQDNGASITHDQRFFEAQKYMTLTNHIYGSGSIAVSERFWKRLSKENQEVISETAKEVSVKHNAKNREATREFLQIIGQDGVQISTLSPEVMETFVELGRSVWNDLAPTYGEGRIAELRQEIGIKN